MKVALVLKRYNPYGGYERQAFLLAKALIERGDEVHVFTNYWPEEATSSINMHYVPILKWNSLLKHTSFAFFARQKLKPIRRQFDLVVGFDRTLDMDVYRVGNACHRIWLERKKLIGSPFKRLLSHISPKNWAINAIEKRIFLSQKNRTFIVLSEQGRLQIQRYYPVDSERFVIVSPGVDTQRFNPIYKNKWRSSVRSELCVKVDTPVLLHIGSGFQIKGIATTIKALAKLPAPLNKTVLVVAGKGNTRTYIKLATKLGVQKRIRFIGAVSNPEKLYVSADLFVLPTLLDTFGIVLLESMACGLPVVVSDGAGAAQIVTSHGGGKVLSSPVDHNKLSEVIFSLLTNTNELAQLSREARSLAETFTQEASLINFLQVLDVAAKKRQE